MDELRWKKMELTLHKHNRRLDDHEGRITASEKDINMLEKILEEHRKTNQLITEVVVYAHKTYDVVKPLSRFSGMAVKIFAFGVIVWHGVKWVAAKFALLG